MLEAGRSPFSALGVALGAGFLAMYAVHWVMRQLMRLRHDGTRRIASVVGRTGSVYIPIPGNRSGRGKVQLRTPQGLLECAAVTRHDAKLSTGTVVEVVRVLAGAVLEVEPIDEDAEVEQAET